MRASGKVMEERARELSGKEDELERMRKQRVAFSAFSAS
jgi:hypothetical protein